MVEHFDESRSLFHWNTAVKFDFFNRTWELNSIFKTLTAAQDLDTQPLYEEDVLYKLGVNFLGGVVIVLCLLVILKRVPFLSIASSSLSRSLFDAWNLHNCLYLPTAQLMYVGMKSYENTVTAGTDQEIGSYFSTL